MNLTLTELSSFFPAQNRVLVRPVVDTSKVTYGSLTIHNPTVDGKPYDAFKSAPVVCEVVTPPRKLIFGKRKTPHESVEELDVPVNVKMRLWEHRREAKYTETTMVETPIPGSMMWKTTVQARHGDIVWVNANALLAAERMDMVITADDKPYYLIPYEAIYLKKKESDVQMLNGWVLAELVEDNPSWQKRAEQMGLFIPSIMKKQEFNDRLGVIRYIGDPVEYLFQDRYDHPEPKVGDVVMFKWKVNRRLEPGQRFFAKDVDLIVTRRTNIKAIIN